MRTVIGSVETLNGKFFAKDAEGNIIELKIGDEITQDMIVFGDEENSASANIKMAMLNDEEAVVVEANGERSFDESISFEDEEFDLDLSSEEEAETTADDEDEEFDEETESGDEKAKDSEGGSDQFAARDGNAVDVNSGLRSAKFQLTSHTFEI
ncbi:MAG: hypothetical protein COB99_08220, partial [Sulfurimonas sp.]